jgi:hypothetical protein
LRSTEFDAGRKADSRELARKRLEAIRQTRQMPTDEEPHAATREQTVSPEPDGSEADE